VKRWFASLVVAGLGLLAGAEPAWAACTISTTPLGFGTYNVFATAPVDATATITFRCGAADHNIRITLDPGMAGSFNPRQMQRPDGSDRLSYNVYRDAGHTQIWGDGSAGTQIYSNGNPPNNVDVTLTIFGRIPAGQDVSVGGYSDTVVATIFF
jgi:spore coat protein U-like protein